MKRIPKGLILAYLEDAQIKAIPVKFKEFKKDFPELEESSFQKDLARVQKINNQGIMVEEVEKKIYGIKKIKTSGKAHHYVNTTLYKYINGEFSQEGKMEAIQGYDQENRLIESYDTLGLQLSLEYDSLGNLISEVIYNEVDKETDLRTKTDKILYKYHESGIRISSHHFVYEKGLVLIDSIQELLKFDSLGDLQEKRLVVNGVSINKRVYSMNLQEPSLERKSPTEKKKYWYENGELMVDGCGATTVQSDAGGSFKILENYNFKYDTAGNIIEVEGGAKSEKKKLIRFTYDEKGQLLKEELFIGGELEKVITYRYNENGLLIKETYENGEGVKTAIKVFVY